jgi:hypothetical protein
MPARRLRTPALALPGFAATMVRMAYVDDELFQRLLKLVYRQLMQDTPTPHARSSPMRFASLGAMERTRAEARAMCEEAAADSDFIEYVDEHWMTQFKPLLC